MKDNTHRPVSRVSSKARPLVLLAEPRDELRELYAEYLARSGFHVVEAVDAAEAIDKSLELCPAGLVVDLALDGIDGLRVVRRLREDERTFELPILVLGPDVAPTAAMVARNAGADAFVSKPCLPSTLLTELMRMLAHARSAPSSTGSF